MFWLVVAFGFVWAIISLVKLNASSCAYSSPNYEQPLRYCCSSPCVPSPPLVPGVRVIICFL
jgi:hypothetical protein